MMISVAALRDRVEGLHLRPWGSMRLSWVPHPTHGTYTHVSVLLSQSRPYYRHLFISIVLLTSLRVRRNESATRCRWPPSMSLCQTAVLISCPPLANHPGDSFLFHGGRRHRAEHPQRELFAPLLGYFCQMDSEEENYWVTG